jgi:hypothetical protein
MYEKGLSIYDTTVIPISRYLHHVTQLPPFVYSKALQQRSGTAVSGTSSLRE